MDTQEMTPQNYQVIIDRFITACHADERVVAATLYGSYATGTADAYSDLDLLITDEAYEDFLAGREAFIRMLGEPVFLEDFDLPNIMFCIFSDGTEVELSFGCESRFPHNRGGSYTVLLDKKHILAGAVFPWHHPAQAEQVETLRRLVYWFWHDLSHFIAALGRGQLWWAYGQIEALRRYCVNLARLRQDFAVEADGYDKVEQALPVEQLSSLQSTCCPLEPEAMLRAALVIVRFYQEVAPRLARTYGITYPTDLERVMSERLENLCEARLS